MRNRLINIIPIQERTWEISFDMVLLESSSAIGSTLHFTVGGNHGKYGDRTPAIFTRENKIMFRSNIDHQNAQFSIDHEIQLNQKVNVKMQQVYHMTDTQNTVVRIFIDGNKIYTRNHRWTIPFENVKCYFGDPWYDPSPVRISNLRYTQQLLYPGKSSFLDDVLYYSVFVENKSFKSHSI